MSKPNILTLDIETLPAVSFHFRMWDENIGPDMYKERSRVYSVGYRWLGDTETKYLSAPTWEDIPALLIQIHALLNKADAVVVYNGKKFDLPRLEGEFAQLGLPPLGKLTVIDVLETVKTFALPSNKLQYALEYFKCGKKVKTEGFPLWVKVYYQDPAAMKKMMVYCKGDVLGLERLYKKLRPRIKNHPDLFYGMGCPVCGTEKFTKLRQRHTKLYAIDVCRCHKCAHVYEGKRTRVRR